MWLNNGVWVKGPRPRSKTPKVVTHRSQKTTVAPSTRRLDALLKGEARICIFRKLGGLGDMIMATPIARGAKKKYPNSHVTFAVPSDYANGDLVAALENIPYIDEIIDYKLVDRDNYDAFADITMAALGEEKPYATPPNRIDLFAKAAGIPLFGHFLPLYVVTEEEKEWGEEFYKKALGNKTPRGTIAIHIQSNDPRRTWPAHRIREFVSLAKESGFRCFLFEWKARASDWRLAGATQVFGYKIRQAAAIMNCCDVLVCPDSSILHLGGALNMRIVSLFGPIPPACRINHYPNTVAVVNQQVSCLGCFYSPCSHNNYCMNSIMPQSVLNAVKRRIKEPIVEPSVPSMRDNIVQPGNSVARRISTFAI